jgi:hypothetical protein
MHYSKLLSALGPPTQCCGSGMCITNPGSRNQIFIHPGCRIQQQQQKKRGN